MPLAKKETIEMWTKKDSWVYKNFSYFWDNPFWSLDVPRGFSLCPYFWIALLALFVLRPLAFFTWPIRKIVSAGCKKLDVALRPTFGREYAGGNLMAAFTFSIKWLGIIMLGAVALLLISLFIFKIIPDFFAFIMANKLGFFKFLGWCTVPFIGYFVFIKAADVFNPIMAWIDKKFPARKNTLAEEETVREQTVSQQMLYYWLDDMGAPYRQAYLDFDDYTGEGYGDLVRGFLKNYAHKFVGLSYTGDDYHVEGKCVWQVIAERNKLTIPTPEQFTEYMKKVSKRAMKFRKFFDLLESGMDNIGTFFEFIWEYIKASKTKSCPYLTFKD